eukprot:TRINITY_DN37823_c0_g1_i1.p3 TRINITY_DN37823_c0_g1~~TRINITY_DN37823_c0_g1_i1.p3  ORF type:complete len:229 (+),score=71.50 TRINITY_DN37823_c0_g1_i1:1379-2065(+)
MNVITAQAIDSCCFLYVGLRPSVMSFCLWQLLREFTRRAFKPARLAMLGDLVGRDSIEFVYADQAIDTIAELLKIIVLQLCARIVTDGKYHRSFLIGSACNAVALLACSVLKETMTQKKKRKIQFKKSHPLAFMQLFQRSEGMTAMGVLLATWSMSGRKMLPVKEYQKKLFGMDMAQQANLMLSIQLCELASPVLLPKVLNHLGPKGAAQLSHILSCLLYTSPSPRDS